MPLVISPKTTSEAVRIFTNVLLLHKVPRTKTSFWHGNFADAFYEGLGGRVNVLFTGYSGAVVGQALLEYADRYMKTDPFPEIYFVGSVLAFDHSALEVGDLAYAVDAFSPDSFEQALYRNAEARGIRDYRKPNPELMDHVLNCAGNLGLRFKPVKVYCRISPGYMPDFTHASQLISEAMWWKMALGHQREFDGGEYESAAALAAARLFGLPAVALLDVKDKRTKDDYRVISPERRIKALHEILSVVRESLLSKIS